MRNLWRALSRRVISSDLHFNIIKVTNSTGKVRREEILAEKKHIRSTEMISLIHGKL
jgi:hypothetical protein